MHNNKQTPNISIVIVMSTPSLELNPLFVLIIRIYQSAIALTWGYADSAATDATILTA